MTEEEARELERHAAQLRARALATPEGQAREQERRERLSALASALSSRLGRSVTPEEAATFQVAGEPGTMPCKECGATLERSLAVAEGTKSARWTFVRHDCPTVAAREQERQNWLRQMTEQAAAEHRALCENPTPERIAALRRASRLPRWTPAGLSHLVPPRPLRPALELFTQHRERWCSGPRPERGIWLWGGTDMRKTALCSALLFEIANWTRHRALFWNVEDLMDQIRRQARGDRHHYDPAEIEAADALCLDDVGTTKVSERSWVTLFGIVNASLDGWGRESAGQVLYVTSNEGPEAMVNLLRLPDRPDSGERIVRRLVQACEVVGVG